MLKFKFFTSNNILELEQKMNEWGDDNPTFDVQDVRISSFGTPTKTGNLFPNTANERHIVIVLYTAPPE